MADKPAQKKRVVKNPETFRERAIKASEAEDQLGRSKRLRQIGGNASRPFTRPVASAGKKAGQLKAIKALRRPFHLLGLVLFPPYFRNSWQELKLVKWPSRRDSRRLTFAVLIFAIIFGAAIALVDYGLDKLFKNILLK